ncbi:uncharacterized protein LOC62_03G005007 [Vanrija pseudolonga]|uniref:Uncharacterized protein n=1 Tax=Vanrija pseudolonga TaxID=143232 RepID=A0AAF0Y7H0_9TREE|nr:hypothetical protein LOC62_03G005007 [Vanrija pseudolonga]
MPDAAADPANPRVIFTPSGLPPTLPPNPANIASHEAPDSPAPASAHDAIVSRLLVRPAMPARSASAPTAAETPMGRSVAELMDAPLEPSGARVTNALNSHISAVLAAQEEIGRAHLALEGIGDPFEDRAESARQLAAREAGVDAIMARLAELSQTLKSYHDLGTPVFAFAPAAPRTPTPQGSVSSPVHARKPVVTIAHRGVPPLKDEPSLGVDIARQRPALWLQRLEDGAHHVHASPTEMSAKSPLGAKSPLSAETPAMSPF